MAALHGGGDGSGGGSGPGGNEAAAFVMSPSPSLLLSPLPLLRVVSNGWNQAALARPRPSPAPSFPACLPPVGLPVAIQSPPTVGPSAVRPTWAASATAAAASKKEKMMIILSILLPVRPSVRPPVYDISRRLTSSSFSSFSSLEVIRGRRK